MKKTEMKRYIAVVNSSGTKYRFPIFAESYDIAKRKLRNLYPAEYLRTRKITAIISPYRS